jgi:hypothetical protein
LELQYSQGATSTLNHNQVKYIPKISHLPKISHPLALKACMWQHGLTGRSTRVNERQFFIFKLI